MNTIHPLLLAGAALLVLAPTAGAQSETGKKKLYCWNENGRKVCGDALPATAVDSARTEISAKSGLATGQVARALNAEERAAAAAKAEAERQAEFATQAARMRERAMIESYATETDLRRAFGERIALLDGTIKASQLSVGGLRQSLLSLLRQAGEAELGRKPVTSALAVNIHTQHVELMRQQGMLAQQRRDRSEIDAELTYAVERYRELKKPPVQAIAPLEGG
jgi:hypothetical protein